MVGMVVECPSCEQHIKVPGAAVAESAPEGPGAEPEEAEAAPAAPSCPSCGVDMEADAVLCVQCGFHTKLGKQIKTDVS
jgi:hypothetical protein